jgi:hypothetical protein
MDHTTNLRTIEFIESRARKPLKWRECAKSINGQSVVFDTESKCWKKIAKAMGKSAPSRGLGDTIARAIQAVTLGTVKPCGGCKKRQEALNKLVPYRP